LKCGGGAIKVELTGKDGLLGSLIEGAEKVGGAAREARAEGGVDCLGKAAILRSLELEVRVERHILLHEPKVVGRLVSDATRDLSISWLQTNV